MKKIAVKLVVCAAFIAASVIGGLYLSHLPDLIPCGNITDIFPCSDMPYSVEMFIRFCLSVIGRSDLANPDDMEALAALLYWAIATLLVGAFLFLCYFAVRRHRAKKIHEQ
ncbi:conserved exported hypothetical protein [Paraburkholderia piptadeniae]|uniref:Uncharacterized protein n=1 Tax=Paraburkholderia piptadeniae TaxID=1701573 RepID=A0A1N7RU81_9BURK|nr:hypothetical protein [Paraburkholderia piptadeniae]SIT38672.1 conserved exported hypothetical protein [Paraburkholderia piptadeniae]